MAVLAGNAGKVQVGSSTVAEIDQWSLNIDRNLTNTQSFGDTWEESTATLGKFSGTFQGRYDNTDTNGHIALQNAALAGTTVSVKLYVDATHYFSGSVFLTMNPKADESGVVEASYSFTGTGALTYT